MGPIHSNYASFTRKGILTMPYISLMSSKNSKESLTPIFCTVILYYIFHLSENYGCHDDMVTDSRRQSQARNGVFVYTIVQNSKVTHTQ